MYIVACYTLCHGVLDYTTPIRKYIPIGTISFTLLVWFVVKPCGLNLNHRFRSKMKTIYMYIVHVNVGLLYISTRFI